MTVDLFFFQAEDGIRDHCVTGVQTCALPIYVTIQHQLTPTMAIEGSYVGNKGTHVFAGLGPDYDINQPTVVGYYDPSCPNKNLDGTIKVPCVSQSQRKPFFAKFGWEQNFHYFGNDSNNNYNALQAKFEKRFATGYSFEAHYTLARAY